MTRRRHFKTLDDIERHFRNGFGCGEGSRYKPWLLVRDVPSQGRSHILWSDLCGREHHLLSDHECRYFLIQLWIGGLTDVRECYPLPLTSTLAIASGLGIRHPVYPGTITPAIMTTDFLLTRKSPDGKAELLARSIKPREKLSGRGSRRVLEKEEIQRVYWRLAGIGWKLVTDAEIDCMLADNLSFASAAARIAQVTADKAGQNNFMATARCTCWTARPLAHTVRELSKLIDRPFEHGVNLFKLQVWKRRMRFNLSAGKLHMTEPLWEEPTFEECAAG